MSLIIPVYPTRCQNKSWKIYLKEAITDPQQLLAQLKLLPEQLNFEVDLENSFSMRIPQPFIDKMQSGDPFDPLFLQVISQANENIEVKGFTCDPLQENNNQEPGLLHKYHGRVLLILSSACAINCRYCFRRHFPYQDQLATGEQLQNSLDYIANDSTITEVILSGGDPLIVSDNFLNSLLDKLGQLPHIKRLRIHTRLPVVIPQRITNDFCQILKNSRLQISIVLHINHPNEIDPILEKQLQRLANSGVQLLNQSVLLKGINDSTDTLCELSEKLFSVKVLPYYLHQLDKVQGAAHFSVNEHKAIDIIKAMRARLPGYLVPRLAREDAGNNAKTIIS